MTAFFMSAKSRTMPPLWSPSITTSTWYVWPCCRPHFSWPGRWWAASMYSVMPSFTRRPRPRRYMAFASERGDGQDDERRPTPFLEPVLLPPGNDEHVALSDRRLPSAREEHAVARGDEHLVLPVVAM